MALRTFQETLRQRGDKLLRYPPPPPRDLAPPQQVAAQGRTQRGLAGRGVSIQRPAQLA